MKLLLLKFSFTEQRKRRKKEELKEMLDYAETRYGKDFVSDVKSLKNVSYMFLPFPIFWALFDQQVRLKVSTGKAFFKY